MKEADSRKESNDLLLPKAPEPFIIITGKDDVIQQKIDSFFQQIVDFLGYSGRAAKAFIERKTQTLGIEEPTCFRPSDDRITLLLVYDHAVASVLERRNNNNYIEVLSACYLTPERVKHLRHRQHLDFLLY